VKKIVKKPKVAAITPVVTEFDKQKYEKERLDRELEIMTTIPTTTTPANTPINTPATTPATNPDTPTSHIERLQQKYSTLKKMV
jgi:hypothetical protein